MAITCQEADGMGSLYDAVRSDEALLAGAAGAIGELVAAADLMRRGYLVYRALSPVSPCDLLAYRADSIRRRSPLRVEVRVGQLSKHGMLSFRLKPNDEGTFDVLALVVKGSEVYYLPQIPGTTLCPYKIQVDNLTRLRYWGVLRGALPYQGFQAAVQEEASP